MYELTIIYENSNKIMETFENRILLAKYLQAKTNEVLVNGILIVESRIKPLN